MDTFRQLLVGNAFLHFVFSVAFFTGFFLLVGLLPWFNGSWIAGTVVGILAFILSRYRLAKSRRKGG